MKQEVTNSNWKGEESSPKKKEGSFKKYSIKKICNEGKASFDCIILEQKFFVFEIGDKIFDDRVYIGSKATLFISVI